MTIQERILVTGGSGLVGKAIESVQYLYKSHVFFFVGSKDADLTSYEETKNLFEKLKPTMVIHLAACVGGLFKNMNFKVDMFEKNMYINLNVLKISHEFKIKKVVSCLSTCIFPDKTSYPIDENMLHNGPPHSSNDAYAYAKRMLEIQSKTYQEQYGDNFICVIPTNIYGEHDNYSLEDGHVIPALIHRCYLAKKNGKPFDIRGSGTPLRQFIYSKDLAKLILWSLFDYHETDSIILSVGENDEVSIGKIATIIASNFDYIDQMKFDTSYSDGQYKKTANNKKLIALNPNFKFTNIEEGLKNSIEWFKNNYDNNLRI
jgi:GDP-L-fucose synthase